MYRMLVITSIAFVSSEHHAFVSSVQLIEITGQRLIEVNSELV